MFCQGMSARSPLRCCKLSSCIITTRSSCLQVYGAPQYAHHRPLSLPCPIDVSHQPKSLLRRQDRFPQLTESALLDELFQATRTVHLLARSIHAWPQFRRLIAVFFCQSSRETQTTPPSWVLFCQLWKSLAELAWPSSRSFASRFQVSSCSISAVWILNAANSSCLHPTFCCNNHNTRLLKRFSAGCLKCRFITRQGSFSTFLMRSVNTCFAFFNVASEAHAVRVTSADCIRGVVHFMFLDDVLTASVVAHVQFFL